MAKPETKFCKLVVSVLKAVGAMVFNVHGHRIQASGWPDLYVAHPLWTGWLELKVEGREYQANQIDRIKELRRRGVNAFGLRLQGIRWVMEDIVSGDSWVVDPAKLIHELKEITLGLTGTLKVNPAVYLHEYGNTFSK